MEPPSALMSLIQLVLLGGMAYFPLFIFEYSFLDQWNDSLTSRRSPTASIHNKMYDFIIVGAGTSGSVLAHRLSANFNVLLLETGGSPNPLMSIPALASLFPNHPSVDYAFRTEPQTKACLSLKNRQSLWPRGKGLGGTSNLNFMAYIRGHPSDYDHWANLTRDSAWSYKNLLPYFKKSEHYVPAVQDPKLRKYHGLNGPLNIERSVWSPLTSYFLSAAFELGYPLVDLNAGEYTEGFSSFEYTSKNGRRWGAYQAFLQDVPKSHRLTISKYSMVTKILFNNAANNNTAIGVEFIRHGRTEQAFVTKEVILSAGAIGSPQLLLLSGIGPSRELQRLGISPRVHLPGVGQNLQDHIIGLIGPFTINSSLTFLIDRDNSPTHLFNFARDGSGPLSSSGILATGFIHSSTASKEAIGKTSPDLQLILLSSSLHSQGPHLLSNLFNLNESIAEAYYGPVVGFDSFHIMSLLSRPKSKGYLKLAANDPFVAPILQPNYLKADEDLETVLQGVKKALKLVEDTTSFKSINASLSSTPFPPCSHLPFKSDSYWRCYIRHYTLSVYHQAGTCSMGAKSDKNNNNNNMAVVDSKLNVFGVQNLRVIDASIQPTIISCNIQAICTAIGELGADFIKDKWMVDKKRS